MFPQIVQVVPTEDYTVYVYFEDGKIVCYDVKPQLEKEVALNPYQLKVSGTMTPVNSTLGIDFENYVGAPYPIATDYI